MNLNHNFFDFFKSTEMIKVNNKLLKQIFRKQNIEWNLVLIFFILQLNFRIIDYFNMFSSEIFQEISFELKSIDFTFVHILKRSIKFWYDEMQNSIHHNQAVFNYLTYKVQIWNWFKKLSDKKKKTDIRKYDFDLIKIYHESEFMIMFYQKNFEKLKFR